MQCFVSTLVGFPMSVTCWPRLCGSSPPSERPVAALWTPWSPTGVMSIAIPLGVTTPDTSYSDMAAGSEWVLPLGGGEEEGRVSEGCPGVGLQDWCWCFLHWGERGCWSTGCVTDECRDRLSVFNKCSVTEIGKFDTGDGEKENSNSTRHSTVSFVSAWLVSLYSSADSCAFAVHLLEVGKV